MQRGGASGPLDIGVALALLAGATLACAAPRLPPTPWLIAVAIFSSLAAAAVARLRLAAVFAFGMAWLGLHAAWAMQDRLPKPLEGRDLVLEGRVLGLPQPSPELVRFDFSVEQGEGAAQDLVGKKLRLTRYRPPQVIEPGSRWRLQVRLKRPRGTVNPGDFDFERHALERGLDATGYVREGGENRELAPGRGVHALRARLSAQIAAATGAEGARFVQGLAVGDTRALDERDWEVLRATGITHLMAISGFHVGLVAGFGALLMRAGYRAFPVAGLYLPLPQAAALSALAWAAAYTALAGFALPTVRTLLMIAAALLAVLWRRRFDAWQAFSLAVIAVLLADPLAVLGAGFWLSFLGVAWLLWCLPHAPKASWRSLLGAQGVMSLSLLPLTVWFFGQASWVGPPANLLAVPWVSLVVVPLALLGSLIALLSDTFAAPVFIAAATSMQVLWIVLERAADWHGALAYLPAPDLLALVLALAGAFWLLLPRGVPGKALASLLFLPLLWPARQPPAPDTAEVWMLDVGQGLSVLVRTRHHALLYDAGPAYAGGLDLGDAAVAPALRALGVARLDAYIESHGDNDHGGGSAAVLRAFAPSRHYASDPDALAGQACIRGMRWQWDGVEFAFLHPTPHFPYLGNDSSCVLRIDAGGERALLPGDVSEVVESRLQREPGDGLQAQWLVVPHHGSRSSSSAGFLAAVRPEVALIGVGHRNRFGLPHPLVLQRYADAGIRIGDTAAQGAMQFRLGSGATREVRGLRQRAPRFWREE